MVRSGLGSAAGTVCLHRPPPQRGGSSAFFSPRVAKNGVHSSRSLSLWRRCEGRRGETHLSAICGWSSSPLPVTGEITEDQTQFRLLLDCWNRLSSPSLSHPTLLFHFLSPLQFDHRASRVRSDAPRWSSWLASSLLPLSIAGVGFQTGSVSTSAARSVA